ncbi:MAG: hypothetical protein ACRBCT_04820 [Alphaproteobacteria bacterium]
MPQIDDQTRNHIAAFLPDAVKTAIESYKAFAEEQATKPTQPKPEGDEASETPEPSEEAKKFKSHHDACKVAIAHIELLLKLAQWAEIPEEEITQADLAETILQINGDLGRA